jgi:hypothetical protein
MNAAAAAEHAHRSAIMLRFGYEVGRGNGYPIDLPLKHLVITGQTQQAGKTTALEGLISRSRLCALTFVTKRGESSFRAARRIDPYFREQADWQFVASLLEASRGEKLKFERAWIIRASKGARSLADVQRNVRRAMDKAKGLSADVYLTLDAYLDVVVPQIATVRWAPGLALTPGVNVMDLTALTGEMQHLVIKSALDWVLARETDTVVVIPEAWKFIPQGRGTPVKLAAEAFIRQAAALGNYLWLDSQDIAGIDKIILKSVPVWLLGVQREANEIKRTLDNIPASIAKPSKADIATLTLGQFYACWDHHAFRTYAQPTWLSVTQAQAVACGEMSVAVFPRPLMPHESRRDHVTPEEAARLERDNAQLRAENAELRRRLEALEKGRDDRSQDVSVRPVSRSTVPPPRAGTPSGDRLAESPAPTNGQVDEDTYQAIKARLLAELPSEPVMLQVLAARPELRVEIERHTITIDGDTLRGRLAQLLAEHFFDEAQTTGTVSGELTRRGFPNAASNVSRELGELAKLGFLTTSNKWWRAVPEAIVRVVDKES